MSRDCEHRQLARSCEICRLVECENAELTVELAEYERTVAHMRDGARLQDSATAAVMERAEKAEAEMKEQCRLLAMGSEREARLMARVAELERDAHRALVALEAMQMEARARACGLKICDDAIEELRSALRGLEAGETYAAIDTAMRGTE